MYTPANIRLGWRCLTPTSPPAQYVTELFTTLKIFTALAPGLHSGAMTFSAMTICIIGLVATLDIMTLSTEIKYQCVESYYVWYAKWCYAGVITISITTLSIMTVSVMTISMT